MKRTRTAPRPIGYTTYHGDAIGGSQGINFAKASFEEAHTTVPPYETRSSTAGFRFLVAIRTESALVSSAALLAPNGAAQVRGQQIATPAVEEWQKCLY